MTGVFGQEFKFKGIGQLKNKILLEYVCTKDGIRKENRLNW